jgi:hypothetical protein
MRSSSASFFRRSTFIFMTSHAGNISPPVPHARKVDSLKEKVSRITYPYPYTLKKIVSLINYPYPYTFR